MKKLFASLILLALSSTVFAQEHRSHVAESLERASGHLTVAEGHVSTTARYYTVGYTLHVGAIAEPNFRGNADYAFLYFAKAHDTIAEILAIIHEVTACTSDPNAQDLFDIRRMMNKPWRDSTGEEGLASEVATIQQHVARMTGAHITSPNTGNLDPGSNLRSAGQSVVEAWREIDFAIWHINDAILQEAPLGCS